MDLYPAIDIRRGSSVRLYQGDFGRETIYGDPLQLARELVARGAERLHLVDLDAARTGHAGNGPLVRAILSTVDVPIQVGGGVRDENGAAGLLAAGASRVVIGTAALDAPEMVVSLVERFPERIVVGVDHHGGMVAVRGWQEVTSSPITEVFSRYAGIALAGAVVTDISRDGAMAGPDVSGLSSVVGATALRVIASGGVRDVADLIALREVEARGRRLDGVIVGKALAEGALSIEEAIAACASPA